MQNTDNPQGGDQGSPAMAQGGDQGSPANDQRTPATPQENMAYNKVLLAGSRLLYAQQTNADIIRMVKSADPAEGMARAVVMIMIILFRKSGGKLPLEVIIPVGMNIMGQIADFCERAGIFKVDKKLIDQAAADTTYSLLKQFEQVDIAQQKSQPAGGVGNPGTPPASPPPSGQPQGEPPPAGASPSQGLLNQAAAGGAS